MIYPSKKISPKRIGQEIQILPSGIFFWYVVRDTCDIKIEHYNHLPNWDNSQSYSLLSDE